MKKNFIYLALVMACFSLVLASCGGDDDDSPSIPDPEGTVTTNFDLAGGTKRQLDLFGYGTEFYIGGNHFEVGDNTFKSSNHYLYFCDMGEVSGLANITTLPKTGWNREVTIYPGHGYAVRYINQELKVQKYARLYVVRAYDNQSDGGAAGYVVKYQTPYDFD